MSGFPLSLPDDRNEPAMEQTEVECTFAAGAVRAIPERAREILARVGYGDPLRPCDELEVEDKRS